MTKRFIGFDLGAESGRCIVGTLSDGNLKLEEVHRFTTHTVRFHGGFHWDILAIAEEMLKGLVSARKSHGPDFEGIGVDTWGVDYVLVDPDGRVLGYPYHYRDDRTDTIMPEAFAVVPKEALYGKTGIQFMQFNTVFQLLAEKKRRLSLLDPAGAMLLIPDFFNFMFSGVMKSEYTIASTTGLIDPAKREWSWELIDKFGIGRHIFPGIVEPGTILGPLLPGIASRTGLNPGIPVIATACHDTASAVASVPASEGSWSFLSSGTWSLMGVELQKPVLSPAAMKYNFTNEGGVNGTIRFLKNLAGLWPVQECRRSWMEEKKEFSYMQLSGLAREEGFAGAWVDLADPRFLKAGEMPQKIMGCVRETGGETKTGPGWIIRVVLESLAFSYRKTIREIEEVTGVRIERLHAVGGGIQNELLAQFAADATGLTVYAGPVEGTIVGNLGVQAVARGIVSGYQEWRKIVSGSFDLNVYNPRETAYFDANEKKYERILNRN
jgi:rhamnulokinase